MLHYLLFIIIRLNSGLEVSSQGGWNIGYIYVSEVTTQLVGKNVRLDFRHDRQTLKKPATVRALISPEDTGSVMTDSGRIKFLEKRVLYVDQGFIREQTLVSKNTTYADSITIYDSEILEVTDKYIKLKLYTDEKDPAPFLMGQVDRAQLDGLMIEIKQ